MIDEMRSKMLAALQHLQADLGTVRTGRANPALVENVLAEVYGTKMPLIQLATISTPDSRQIIITPFDLTNTAAISKAIQGTNLGLMPAIDGDIIRLTIPALTEERRQEYIKLAHQKVESGRVQIRQLRHEEMEEVGRLEKDGKIGKDEKERQEKESQKITDEMTEKIDEMSKRKEEELLQV